MNVLTETVELVDFTFECACVILPAFKSTTQARLEDWVFEIELQLRAMRDDLSLILKQNLMQEVGRKDTVLKSVEHTHDPRHVDALLVCLQRDCASDRGFECLGIRSRRNITQREPEV